ncbi:MAG: recombinase family protein [Clostridia bacterium]|nr:recombinase family protein [Clostridia bacterium]
MKTVTKVMLPRLDAVALKRVAAYARVSTGKDAMLHSLSAQVSYYKSYIESHRNWTFAGVYADEAKTGTKDTRESFKRLLEDCRAGKIDLVVTKSVSRFARNTVTLLQTIRELKTLGVDVYFEEQNLHTMSADGELMLTVLASYAQEESLSASENMKWRVKRSFEDGLPWNRTIYGYRFKDNAFRIVDSEAKVIRLIYDLYLQGMGHVSIANKLNDEGYPTRNGKKWKRANIRDVINNYTYTGNLILQKTYVSDHLTKKKEINIGTLPKYHIEDSHEPIIDMGTYNLAQLEMKRRAEKVAGRKAPMHSPLKSLITCACCGKHYRRKVTKYNTVWICSTYNTQGKSACPSKQIPEVILFETIDSLGIKVEEIKSITAEPYNTLRIELKNGQTLDATWRDRSRSESWTDEMKETARNKTLERMKSVG